MTGDLRHCQGGLERHAGFGREDSGLSKSDGFESFNKNQAALTKAIEENNRLLAENNQATAANTWQAREDHAGGR